MNKVPCISIRNVMIYFFNSKMCFVLNKGNINLYFCNSPLPIRILQEAHALLSPLSQFTSVGFLFKSSSGEVSTYT